MLMSVRYPDAIGTETCAEAVTAFDELNLVDQRHLAAVRMRQDLYRWRHA